jgi:hypothetical protein
MSLSRPACKAANELLIHFGPVASCGVEHRHRPNHDIDHRYLADPSAFPSISETSLETTHYQTHGNEQLLLPRVPARSQGRHHFRRKTTFVLKAIPEKKVNKNEEAMRGETHILQDVGQPYMVSLSSPNNACVRERYSFVTYVVV